MTTMTTVPPLLQTIVHWPHAYTGVAHCLARIYRLPEQVLVVLSAVRSNPIWLGLTLDFPGAANALQSTIESLGIAPVAIMWIAHHGEFSSYDAVGPEEFSQVKLHWTNDAWVGNLADWHRLAPATVDQLQQTVALAPVLEVLPAIGWMQA